MNSNPAGMPYIKSEPDEYGNNPNFMNQYQSHQSFNQFGSHNNGSVNPSDLSMGSGGFSNSFGFGGGHNMSSSFNMGSSGFGEDELLESLGDTNEFSGMHHQSSGSQAIPMTQPHMNNIYSHTPDGGPIQSPFTGNFDYNQFRMNSIPQHMSPHQHNQYMNKRPNMQTTHRKSSADQRSPMTPRTAASLAGLTIGTPDSSTMQQNGRAIRAPNVATGHQKTGSGQFDGTPGSMHSYLDSPLSSPGTQLHHAGISETLSAKHASLPSKVENGSNAQSLESQEAKKRRRRASHNAVERRRRDNINERIQDLSHLVPQHRLEDDKVKKQLANNGSLSPTVGATSMSPPNNAATSLLAGASGRRATSTTGNITLGLPMDDKEKGPNKGDILNGSVSWTRDLMWALYQKYMQEEELAQYITSLGGHWPFAMSDDDKRMRSEVMDAIDKNDPTSFSYSRTDGSGLRVPKHTTLAGDRLQGNNNSSQSPQSNLELSPAFNSGGSGTNSGSNHGQAQFWNSGGHAGISFKEEDEFMDMNT